MTTLSRRTRQSVDIWPGFVDALAALLMVVIFVLMVFVLSQFYLRETLSGQEKALQQLHAQIGELSELLSLERQDNADLRLNIEQLSGELQSSIAESEKLGAEIGELTTSLRQNEEVVAGLEDRLAEESGKTVAALEEAMAGQKSLTQERQLGARQRDELALLNRQIAALRSQLATLSAALESSERKDQKSQVKISDLGKRLNVALAGKVQELAKYRSEFFGRLRQVLGARADISIVGDRFVFQSEVLFESGSADLGYEGKAQLARLAETLLEIASQIPTNLDWILRVDGHTDLVPISNERFRSNWELSSARAISVVKYLIQKGIPPARLAAAGFGEFSPLDGKKDPLAFRRNRRIELKLTQH